MNHSTGGRAGREVEIVQVKGGRIIRSTSKKDKHSKVYTAKGQRDRRVRLSAHTAIQFYDVQDRLGYDRPSKAVDWLFKQAKNAIDKLDELPPWCPNVTEQGDLSATTSLGIQEQNNMPCENVFQLQKQIQEANNPTSSYIPQEHDEQCIRDTMKTFFPTTSGISLVNFQNYSHEDQLGLSLHTSNNQVKLSGFEANYGKTTVDGWGNMRNPGENNNGIIFNSSNQEISEHPPFCQSQEFNQRGPQPNNYYHLTHSWDHHRASMASVNNHNAYQSSMSNSHFESSLFQVPARIQAEEQSGGNWNLQWAEQD